MTKKKNTPFKIITLIANIISVLCVAVFEYIGYKIITYNDNLAMNYVPIKIIVIIEIALALFVIIPFFIRRTKTGAIISLIMSIIVIALTLGATIWSYNNLDNIKGFLDKSEHTLDTIVENSKLSTDEFGVYVLKSDKAESLEDAKGYVFGCNENLFREDTTKVINAINKQLASSISVSNYGDSSEMIGAFMGGNVRAIILNKSLIELIESIGDDTDDDTDNGHYVDFSSKIKCIYTYDITKKINKNTKVKDITKDTFNVYISGIDTFGSVTTQSRSDVNIIMSVNPKTHQILLVSTPRDYYVPLSISNGVKDKLTHAGLYGIETSMGTLENLYNIKCDYYVRVNFTGFTDIIDALGGIDVESDYSFYAKGYSFNEGINRNLSGEAALVFARERKSFGTGDRQRGENQMKVIKAVVEKSASPSILNNYDTILSSISESFQTDVSKKNIQKFVKYQLANNPEWNVVTYSVSGVGQKNYTYSIPSARSYVMVPDQTTVDTAKRFFSKLSKGKKLSEE